LHAPYHKEFIARLKREIPEEEQQWRGSGRWISDAYLREVEIMVFDYFEV
jgi:hypothetical protein